MIQELRLVDNVCMLIQKFPQEQWARIPTPYSIKDKDTRLWDTTKCDGSYTWYLYISHVSHTDCSMALSPFLCPFSTTLLTSHLELSISKLTVTDHHYLHFVSFLSIDQILCLPSLRCRDLAWICSSYLWIDRSKLHTMSWWHPL